MSVHNLYLGIISSSESCCNWVINYIFWLQELIHICSFLNRGLHFCKWSTNINRAISSPASFGCLWRQSPSLLHLNSMLLVDMVNHLAESPQMLRGSLVLAVHLHHEVESPFWMPVWLWSVWGLTCIFRLQKALRPTLMIGQGERHRTRSSSFNGGTLSPCPAVPEVDCSSCPSSPQPCSVTRKLWPGQWIPIKGFVLMLTKASCRWGA